MINREPESFYSWVNQRLQGHPELPPDVKIEIYNEIREYIDESQKSQNIPYDSLIYSLGNKVQFLNSFLLKKGFSPIRSQRSPLKNFIITALVLGIVLIAAAFGFYQFIKHQFDFDMADGQIKLFGQTLDVDEDNIKVDIDGQFSTRFVSKSIELPAEIKNIEISLKNTKTTISFIETNELVYDCRIPINDDHVSRVVGDTYEISLGKSSNCEIRIPRNLFLDLEFTNGRLTLDKPVSSFKIDGENGALVWIKNPSSKFQLFFEVKNQAQLGDFQDIFDQNAPRKAEIKLENGAINFVNG